MKNRYEIQRPASVDTRGHFFKIKIQNKFKIQRPASVDTRGHLLRQTASWPAQIPNQYKNDKM
jgi:hypothetical protein